ncbi:MAG: thiamine pyrophosphate-dependent enzyme [Dehalococcoidia bacterium]|nr:thiamine pyrophosphate-dependent enzyme [Dehalococcoidia bacterium]
MERQRVSGTPVIWREGVEAAFCPGCHDGTIGRLMLEAVDEMGIRDNTVCISGVTCAGFLSLGMEMDSVICVAHGRAPDVATGLKRALFYRPVVFTIQGDGDTIAIGAGSLINAAMRAENITVCMVNNTVYGTTGGQMAPTSLPGQITTTTPTGRERLNGLPALVPEMLATLDGVAYAARGAVNTPANYQKTKKFFKQALTRQMEGAGMTFVEFLSACPPNWKLNPLESLKRIEEEMIPAYPIGEFKT